MLIDGSPTIESSPLNFCLDNRSQNGDLDVDGNDYQPNTWPDGTSNHPTPASYPGLTTQDFGKDAEYGTPDVARFGGTSTSPVIPNPEFSGRCGPKGPRLRN